MKTICWVLAALSTATVWGQITKDELYEMTEVGLDESTIVSIVERNCVDFELDGQVIVELSGRVSGEVLRTVVDCIQLRKEMPAAVAPTPDVAPKAVLPTEEVIESAMEADSDSFELPSYVTIALSSNKSTFTATELELRIVSSADDRDNPLEIRYRYSGEAEADNEIRCYKKKGPDELVPGEYIAYLHVVSNRRSMMGKRSTRSDLHKFRVEYKGPGPIHLKYTSQEVKAFRQEKDLSVEAHGPLLFFGGEHISVEGQKSLEDLLDTAGK